MKGSVVDLDLFRSGIVYTVVNFLDPGLGVVIRVSDTCGTDPGSRIREG
jgi:hypothetical protein